MGGNVEDEVLVVAETRDGMNDVDRVKLDDMNDAGVLRRKSKNRLSWGYTSEEGGYEEDVIVFRRKC